MSDKPTLRSAPAAALLLEKALGPGKHELTIADAAAKSGLPLRDAERGLHHLVSTYRGHLRVTEDGDLLFLFPHGFTRPWIEPKAFDRALSAIGRALLGAARFIVRAWIMIVLVGYALLFVALSIALVFAQSNGGGRSRDRVGFGFGWFFFRMLGDALFWTFHPFSPFAYDRSFAMRGEAPPVAKRDETPFYEKVNRFFFGPTEPPPDPLAQERAILAEIRAQKGRIALADVMRVTGLPREEADPLMAKVLLDFDGEVEVAEQGGIVYRFEGLRKTLGDAHAPPVPPAWAKPRALPPLTGNGDGANLLILALNAFNALMSWFVIEQGLTFAKIAALLQHLPPEQIPHGGTPIALGFVPFVFSLALFALPLLRMLWRPIKARALARENGRLALLATVLEKLRAGGATDAEVKAAWKRASGVEPTDAQVNREVAKLGGDVAIGEGGEVRYRFPDLEEDERAVEAEREAASEEEAKVAPVVFSSET